MPYQKLIKHIFTILFVGIVFYYITLFYFVLDDYNIRISDSEDEISEIAIRAMLLEDKISNCYPRKKNED